MKKFATILLIVCCSFTTFSFSKSEALPLNETSFFKDGFHVQTAVTGIEVTLGGPGTPGFYSWTPIPGSVSSGCFTGVIYVEDTPFGQVVLDVNCDS